MVASVRVGVAGAGAWGLALAEAARRAGSEPLVWSRRPQTVQAAVTGDDAALRSIDMLLLAVPAQEMEGVATRLQAYLAPSLPLVICAKGIARPDNILLDQVLAKVLPGRPVAILSGPNFAAEVARGLPTAVTVASRDIGLAQRVANAIGNPAFRPYVTADTVGVQLGGAIKNVIAIACGVVAGRGLGENARAALMTRGLAEMARLGKAMGAAPETFAGLAGLGDLTLTATSPTSRNFRLGLALGQGATLDAARQSIAGIVEGIDTASAVEGLAAAHGVDMPIATAVAAVVARNAEIGATIGELLARPFKSETA